MKKKIVAILKSVLLFAVENLLIIAGLIFLANGKVWTAFVLALFSIPIAIRDASKRIEGKIDPEVIAIKSASIVLKNIVPKKEDIKA